MQITVINEESRLVVLAHSYVYDTDDNGKVRASGTQSIHLVPGVNVIDEGEWTKAAAHPKVADMVKKKLITVVAKTPTPEDALKKLSADKAADVVGKTNDPALLDKWADTEKRGTVRTAINTQKTKIADEGKASK